MKLAIICPMGRDNAHNLRCNLEQQQFVDVMVCVVENGAGIGSCQRAGFRPHVKLHSDAHPGAAKNVGLRWALGAGMTHFATFDDDDWYGPAYLKELTAALETHDVVGKCAHYCRLTTGCVVLFACADDKIAEQCEVTSLQGPTIASKIWPGMPMFREDQPWGEDLDWCIKMRAAGKSLWATSKKHFCYCRYGKQHGHAYPLRDDQLLAYSIGDLFDVGAWGSGIFRTLQNEHLPSMTPLARPELDFADHPSTELLRKMGADIV